MSETYEEPPLQCKKSMVTGKGVQSNGYSRIDDSQVGPGVDHVDDLSASSHRRPASAGEPAWPTWLGSWSGMEFERFEYLSPPDSLRRTLASVACLLCTSEMFRRKKSRRSSGGPPVAVTPSNKSCERSSRRSLRSRSPADVRAA